ncbi:MAG TPA: hypothetical protein PLF61_02515 [Candidatus Goldiibacteriota bacterium]|nr:hypothetical protein [Candidatus Goldiibacteriota bacterium]
MKKIILLVMIVVFCFTSGPVFAGKMTDKEQKLIATSQENQERTYYPRDLRPSLINLHFGYPYMTGATFSYNINSMFAIGAGVGAYYPGMAGGIHMNVYFLPTTVSLYLSAGVVVLGTAFDSTIFGASGAAGVDFALNNGLCINLGAVYIVSFAESESSFGTAWGGTKNNFNDLGIQMGIGMRF